MGIRAKAVLILAGLAGLAVAGAGSAVEKGDAAPAWHATDFDGHAVDFPAVAAGKPTVVVFWATWCPYCKAFMPYLKNIQADYAAYGVKIVDAKEDGQMTRARTCALFSVAVANGDAIADDYGIKHIPGVPIVDGKGVAARRRPWTDLCGRQVAEL
jgi:thiol-disulfide isomerase/thioredoxin